MSNNMNPLLLLDQAIAFHEKGRLAEAERLYAQALAAAPDNPVLLFNHGTVLKDLKRYPEALKSFDRALAIQPEFAAALNNRGNSLRHLKRFDEALASFDRALAITPDQAELLNNRGLVLSDMTHFEDALASFDRALAIKPDFVEALNNRSGALSDTKRFEQALASIEKALLLRPGSAKIWNNRGTAMQNLKRFDEALASFDRALAIDPEYSAAYCNRGCLFLDDVRLEQALADFDKSLALQPDFAECWNNRGNALRELRRLAEALTSYDMALVLKPDHVDALRGRGQILFEMNRIEEGIATFREAAARIYGHQESPIAGKEPSVRHKMLHDREQHEYLQSRKNTAASKPGDRLAGPAVRPGNHVAETSEQWFTQKPQIAVIDDLLTPEALEGLRRFCLEEPVWRSSYHNGYLGAFPEAGFACPLLGQIADELRNTFPGIFRDHTLNYMWGFKYDSKLSGIAIHADRAAVNVNFWITPDEANLDPESGGLVIWDVAAPLDWNFAKFNADNDAIRDFLARHGSRPTRVPHRQNRAVIFDSDLFHETDTIRFKDGYLNRRINVTMLYGRRGA